LSALALAAASEEKMQVKADKQDNDSETQSVEEVS
jgi:hypothetical protein